ncbi:TIGR03086 family metal-binding protein [Nakamurella sp. GG22]
MTEPATVDQLARATQVCAGLVAGVASTGWTARTPCSEWTVRDLVVHLILGKHLFADALLPDAPRTVADTAKYLENPDADLPAAFDIAGQLLLQAFSTPDAMSRMITVPFGTIPGAVALHLRIVEMLVHGWDLAAATGTRVEFPDDLAEQEIAFSAQNLSRVPPGRRRFADRQSSADDAPAIDRLAALLGREVPFDRAR